MSVQKLLSFHNLENGGKVFQPERNGSILKAERLIEDIVNNGPIGLPHIGTVVLLIKRPIRIVSQTGNVLCGFEIASDEERIVVQYCDYGHWQPFGDVGRSDYKSEGINDCFFDALARQMGRDGKPTLRSDVADSMKSNLAVVADIMEEVAWLRKNDRSSLMYGGARYDGRTPEDAGELIDESQGVSCHGGSTGHPRAHVSDPNATGPIDSVERYSMTSTEDNYKSGYFTKEDQNRVVHDALRSSQGKSAMNSLNSGGKKEAIDYSIRHLRMRMGKYARGTMYEESEAESTTLVLMHQRGQYQNPEADVFILTCYPK